MISTLSKIFDTSDNPLYKRWKNEIGPLRMRRRFYSMITVNIICLALFAAIYSVTRDGTFFPFMFLIWMFLKIQLASVPLRVIAPELKPGIWESILITKQKDWDLTLAVGKLTFLYSVVPYVTITILNAIVLSLLFCDGNLPEWYIIFLAILPIILLGSILSGLGVLAFFIGRNLLRALVIVRILPILLFVCAIFSFPFSGNNPENVFALILTSPELYLSFLYFDPVQFGPHLMAFIFLLIITAGIWILIHYFISKRK